MARWVDSTIRSHEYDTLVRKIGKATGLSFIAFMRRELRGGKQMAEIARELGIDRERLHAYVRANGYRRVSDLRPIAPEPEPSTADTPDPVAEADALAARLRERGDLNQRDEAA
jgi:hypothetical protein